jgi:magnesium transporter
MDTDTAPSPTSRICEHVLVTNVPWVTNPSQTVADTEKYLLTHAKKLETIDYLYITDSDNKLLGVISVKDIFRKPKSTKLEAIMTKDIVHVRPHTKLERAAYLAVSHNIKALPVVDHEEKLLGVVTNDTILDTLYREMQADIFSLAGVHHPKHTMYHGDSVMKLPILTSVWHRIPWLIVGLLGGLAISKVIHLFEDSVSASILVASFIPLVVYMANAIGIQMEAFIVRDYAINPHIKFIPYFLRHTSIVLILSVVLSYLFFWITAFIYKDYLLSTVVSSALFVTIISSVLTGLVIPYLFEKMKMDPASAGGPVGTIIQDAISVVIYLTIASHFL